MKRTDKLEIYVFKLDDEWAATIPEVRGCTAGGDSWEEALMMLGDTLKSLMEDEVACEKGAG